MLASLEPFITGNLRLSSPNSPDQNPSRCLHKPPLVFVGKQTMSIGVAMSSENTHLTLTSKPTHETFSDLSHFIFPYLDLAT